MQSCQVNVGEMENKWLNKCRIGDYIILLQGKNGEAISNTRIL